MKYSLKMFLNIVMGKMAIGKQFFKKSNYFLNYSSKINNGSYL